MRFRASEGSSSGPPALQSSSPRPDNTEVVAGEKRDRERVALGDQVKGEVMVFQPMTIVDISLGGAQIETSFALHVDSLHDFRLSLGHQLVIVKGRIAHCHIGELTDVSARYRSGVEFVEVSEHVSSALADFVAASAHARSMPRVLDGLVADDEQGRG